jgi:hypothetical protein
MHVNLWYTYDKEIYEELCPMLNRQQVNLVNYMVVCINEFALRYNLSSKDAFEYLIKHNAITFLKENYEIEHTLSIEDAIDDVVMVCKKNGGHLS